MGIVENINADRFPKQGTYVGMRCRVCFHYDTSCYLYGTIVRDDAEEPHRTIIVLDDGRCVLGTECQFQPESMWLHE